MSDQTTTEATATTEQLTAHVDAAVNFVRNRQPVTRVGRESKSQRPVCLGCGFGIRRETKPIEGMHPRCHRVANENTVALQNKVNTVAARVPSDIKRVAADPTLKAELVKQHADLLARFEASEAARTEKAAS